MNIEATDKVAKRNVQMKMLMNLPRIVSLVSTFL